MQMRFLKWSLLFFIASLVAGTFGFSETAYLTSLVAKVLLVVFVASLVVLVVGTAVEWFWCRRHGEARMPP